MHIIKAHFTRSYFSLFALTTNIRTLVSLSPSQHLPSIPSLGSVQQSHYHHSSSSVSRGWLCPVSLTSKTKSCQQRSYLEMLCSRFSSGKLYGNCDSSKETKETELNLELTKSPKSADRDSGRPAAAAAKKNMESNTNELKVADDASVHSAYIKEVHDVPIKVLIRSFPSVLDEKKVESLMETIQNPATVNEVPPIDILWVTGRQGGDYYFSFGGCHRYEAYVRLKRETIPCKIVKSTVDDIKSYLGASMPDLL